MKAKRLLRTFSPKHVLKHLSSSRVYRLAAQRYELVYFGTVSPRDDDHELVRGLSVSAAHQDRHYCVGTIEGHDVILLERTDQLTFPGKPAVNYRWTILQVDLTGPKLPHLFLDARRHQSVFYDALFAKFAHFNAADSQLFADHDPRFPQHFSVYSTTQDVPEMIQLLTHDITATIAHHFDRFDFEFFEDRLLVYSSNRTVSLQLVDNMVRAGIWLAREIESQRRL